MPDTTVRPDTRSPLQRAYDDAWSRRDDFEGARARERREALREFEDSLNARLEEKYGEQIRAAREEESRAHEALQREKEEGGKRKQYPYPLGTVMVEWGYPKRLYRSATPVDRSFTGRRGVLEIITADSEHPASWGAWKRAGRGELVIRILKGDGKPSKQYVKAGELWSRKNYGSTERWVPEGTDLLQEDLSWPEAGPESKPESPESGQEMA